MTRFLGLRRTLFAFSLCALTPAAAAGEAPTFEELFEPETPARTPGQITWSPESSQLAFVFEDAEGEALWRMEPAADRREVLLRLGDDGDLDGIDELAWTPDGRRLVLLAEGDIYLLTLEGRELRRLTETEDKEEDPKVSPDGRRLAYVRGGNLYVRPLPEGQEKALTSDGDDREILNGKTDWVYWEELWGRDSTGFWWSGDSRKIAYYRFEETGVETYPLVDFKPTYPEIRWQKYPKAGTTNPTVRVGVLPADGGETRWLDTGDPAGWYLARVHWTADGGVAVERLNREQDRLELVRCDATSGSCKALVSEQAATWVNVGDETTFLADGSFLWGSERSGWREIYLYDAAGELLLQVSRGEGHVTSLDEVLEERGEIVYTRHQPGFLGAKDREVRRTSLDAEQDRILTSGSGWHGATVAADGSWVHRWSDADHAGSWTVRDAAGKALAELPRTASSGYDPERLPNWRYFTIPGPEGVEIPARMVVPPDLDESRKYPAVVYHYGGPESQVVVNSWDSRGRDQWHKWMATRGYVVLMVDNQLSSYFGKKGADRVHRRFGPNHLAAQLEAVKYLRGLGYVDTARVGLWGWSGGGSNTLYCLLNSPGVWKAGVAGAPVTDWRYYDTVWTERYLDRPQDNEEGYRDSSAVTYAGNLEDHLLIVHGTGDDNVHPQNTFALIERFIDEQIPFEDAAYPGQKHGFKPPEWRHFLRRMTDFFDRHLEPGS